MNLTLKETLIVFYQRANKPTNQLAFQVLMQQYYQLDYILLAQSASHQHP